LATLNEGIAGGKVSWMLEADLKNFFGSLSHQMGAPLRGAPRRRSAHDQLGPALVEGRHSGRRRSLSKRRGNPARRFDHVILSNVYLHYVLDLWFERVVKPRLREEADMIDTSTTL